MSEPAADFDQPDETAVEVVDQAQLVETQPGPEQPLMRGYFSLYLTPDGPLLSVRVDGEQADRHVLMPKNVLRMIGIATGTRDPMRMLIEQLGGKG